MDVIGKEVDAKGGADRIRKHIEAFVPQERSRGQKGVLVGFPL